MISPIFVLLMSKNYTQLSLVQRCQIQSFLNVGMIQNVIAQKIGIHPSTISRELSPNTAKRGRTAGVYKAGCVGSERLLPQKHSQLISGFAFLYS